MKKFICLIAIMFMVTGLAMAVPNSFLLTDVSTHSVAGASGVAISTTTFSTTGNKNSPVDATIGITRLILSNSTTATWTVNIYSYGTLASTNTITKIFTTVLPAKTVVGCSVDYKWDTNYEPIIKHILIRKDGTENAIEAGVTGVVTAYVQYYRR